jgi:hypothetical protein
VGNTLFDRTAFGIGAPHVIGRMTLKIRPLGESPLHCPAIQRHVDGEILFSRDGDSQRAS